MRNALWGLTGLCCAACSAGVAAQSFPAKPIRYVVGFAPGGSTDLVARLVAAKMSELLAQQVVVDNRSGAGGTLAAETVARAAPDGYTLFHAGITQAINPALRKNLSYNPLKDFSTVSLLVKLPLVFVVHPTMPAKTIAEFVTLAKASPGRINYGSSGVGAAPHLGMELFKRMAGIDVTHVPYKGSAPALADLLGAQIPSMFDNLPGCLPYIKSGRVRALGIGSLARNAQIPDVPTIAESVPGYEVTVWYGMFAPAGTPANVITKLNQTVVRALATPDVQRRLEENTADASPTTAEGFSNFLKSETTRWGRVIRETGITAE
jgi:tripartite-type tricarboxylate transporter receptor subunit TctC